MSQKIEIELKEEEIKNEANEEGVNVTVKVGVAEIKDKEYEKMEYCLLNKNENEELFELAELISKNNFTDAYKQIKGIKEFKERYEKELEKIEEEKKWKEVEENKVLQPENAKK